jgi:UDP:flavonoid glycosyltransferase YjiC (YdhE family)
VRVLFSSTAGHGHLLPLLPLARAFARAGNAVAIATAPSWGERLAQEGFDVLPVGLETEVANARNARNRERLLALPPDQRRPQGFSHRFATIEAPERVDELRGAVSTWEPDLLVHESGDLVAPLLAALHRLPSVHHGFGRLVPRACFERAAEITAPLWRAAGLEPEPLGGSFRGTYVDICPPSLASEAPPGGTRVESLRPVATGSALEQAPESDRSRPTVYVTLGTIFNELRLFRAVLDGLASLDCEVIATIGRSNDPAALGPIPANAQVERFIPQSEVLPHCRVVVSHAGSGSTLGALAHGLPLLLLPQGADQFDNASACRDVGVARVLMPEEVGPDAIRAGVAELLDEPSYATNAKRIADEIRAMPDADELVRTLVAATS